MKPKKSTSVVLGTVMFAAIASCNQKDEWIKGDQNGKVRDTVVNNRAFRYYGAYWYPLFNGRISPSTYNGATATEISRPSYAPSHVVRSGGFGSSSRTGIS